MRYGAAVRLAFVFSRVGMRRLTSIWVLMFDGPAIVTSELELDDDMMNVCFVLEKSADAKVCTDSR